MTLIEWCRRRGKGAYSDLHFASRVTFKTIFKAAKRGEPVVFEIAEKLSAAVAELEAKAVADGRPAVGLVSIDEIRFPDGVAGPESVAPGAV